EKSYLLLLPDNPHPTTITTRLENRENHLAHNAPYFASGEIGFGGPMLSSHDNTQTKNPDSNNEDDNELNLSKIIGSIHLVHAASEEEVWAMGRADPYAVLGMWDLEAVEVVPVRVLL
ncbi:uncharacterized protein BO97DRAFT_307695, partial [Aspergillus homomorphus CBS 101889]